jgi:hypothetical protein
VRHQKIETTYVRALERRLIPAAPPAALAAGLEYTQVNVGDWRRVGQSDWLVACAWRPGERQEPFFGY